MNIPGKGKHGRYLAVLLCLAGLVLFLETSSSFILNHLVNQEKLNRFEVIFLKDNPYGYYILPHPYLGWVSTDFLDEQNRLLDDITGGRNETVSVVVLGGSTSASGWPLYTEGYLNVRLAEADAPMAAAVYVFAVPSWDLTANLQAYVWMARFLHPEFVVIHQNINDRKDPYTFSQAVINLPPINPYDAGLMGLSRFYKLVRFLYSLSYNRFHYGREVLEENAPAIPLQSRISSYLNNQGTMPFPAHYFFMTDYINASRYPYELPQEKVLAETYSDFLILVDSHNGTLVLTTHYLNSTKEAVWAGFSTEDAQTAEQNSRFINELIRNLSGNHHLPLVDFERSMGPYDFLLEKDGVHFTEEGERIKGEMVGEAIFAILTERYNLTG